MQRKIQEMNKQESVAAASPSEEHPKEAEKSAPSDAKAKPQPPPPGAKPKKENAGAVIAEALYTFQAVEKTELALEKGDRVIVLEAGDVSAWWKGEKDGRIGHFPGNYVNIIEGDVNMLTSAASPPPSESGSGGRAVLCTATAQYDYQGQSTKELSFKKGEVIKVYSQLPSGWWKGSIGSGKPAHFPGAYVQVDQGSAGPEGGQGTQGAAPTSSMGGEEGDMTAEALYDFEPAAPSELALKKGDKILSHKV